MRLAAALFISVISVISLAGCIKATPVTPAPLAPARAAELRGALVGKWLLIDEKKVGGERTKATGTTYFTFSPEGRLLFRIESGFTVNQRYDFALDGANINTTLEGRPTKWMTFRVDNWTGSTLDLFVYDMSRTWFFRRQ